VAQTRRIVAGTAGRICRDEWVARGPARFAVLPLGYADGYHRLASNRAQVLVHGRRAPLAGRVCMDQTMVDVTDAGEVRDGDPVVLFGKPGRARRSGPTRVAGWVETIAYEVLTSVGACAGACTSRLRCLGSRARSERQRQARLVELARRSRRAGRRAPVDGRHGEAPRRRRPPRHAGERPHGLPGDARRRVKTLHPKSTAAFSAGGTSRRTSPRCARTASSDRSRRREPLSLPRDGPRGRTRPSRTRSSRSTRRPSMLRSAAKNHAHVRCSSTPTTTVPSLASSAPSGGSVSGTRTGRLPRRSSARPPATTADRHYLGSRGEGFGSSFHGVDRRRSTCATARIRTRRRRCTGSS